MDHPWSLQEPFKARECISTTYLAGLCCLGDGGSYVGMIWTRVQAIIRGWLGRKRYAKKLQGLEEERRQAKRWVCAIVVQAFWRGRLGRQKGVAIAKDVYRKFMDPTTSRAYYYNPRTKRSIWTKVRVSIEIDKRSIDVYVDMYPCTYLLPMYP